MYSRFGHYRNSSPLRLIDNTLGLDTSPTKNDNCEVCLRANLKNTIYMTSTNTASYNIPDEI